MPRRPVQMIAQGGGNAVYGNFPIDAPNRDWDDRDQFDQSNGTPIPDDYHDISRTPSYFDDRDGDTWHGEGT